MLASATLALPFATNVATTVAHAETTTVVPAKEIYINNNTNSNTNGGSLNGAANSSSSNSNEISNSVSNGANNLSSKAPSMASEIRNGSKNIGEGAVNTSLSLGQIATGSDQFNGGTNKSGFDWGIFDRIDNLLTDGSTHSISLGLKFAYLISFLSIVISVVMIGWALIPFTKLKIGKPLITLISSLIFFGIISGIGGFSFTDNIFTKLFKYITTGSY